MMKLTTLKIYAVLMMWSASIAAFGASAPVISNVEGGSLTRNGSLMTSDISLDLSGLKVKSNQAVIFTPMIVNGADTLCLDGVGVYGRTRWYQYFRAGKRPLSGAGEKALRYSKKLGNIELNQNVAYEEWMNGAELVIKRQDYGCAGCDLGPALIAALPESRYYLPEVKDFEPSFIFREAVAEEVKSRELSGKAYVDFPVNQTVIYPDYRKNTIELAKIIGSIDSVKNDKDITVTSLSIKGFASPEGSYQNNVRLAMGRTEALKNYIQTLYRFPHGFIKTSFEPEDWTGLKEWVMESNIENKQGILDIIDSNLDPDPKNTMIQTTYPIQYQFLLANVYPGLRHSDYTIEYKIKSFTELGEIAEIYSTTPHKLSLNELYRYAASLPFGSDAYAEVFETAARMYPTDATANLNAANAAMMKRDLTRAQNYLNKAGTAADVQYAKGILAALQGDYESALNLVNEAVARGVYDSQGVAAQLQEIIAAQNARKALK